MATDSRGATLEMGGASWSVRSVQAPLASKDQDALCVGASAASVVDGATPLGADWPNDVAEFARELAVILVGLAESSVTQDASTIWNQAVVRMNKRFAPAGYRRSAGAALVRSVGDDLEFSSAGDVQCLVLHADGVARLMDPTLPRLDAWAKAQGGDLKTRQEIRSLANTPQGYLIVSDDESMGSRVQTLHLPADDVEAFWLLTDGGWRLLPDDADEAAASLMSLGLDGLDAIVSLPIDEPDDLTVLGAVRMTW